MMYVIYDNSTGAVIAATDNEANCNRELERLGAGYSSITKENINFSTDVYYDANTDTFSGPTTEEKREKDLEALRAERASLLERSDWTQIPDSPLTDAKKTEWATYRQALRDLPSTTTDFANPVWPSQPS